MRRKRGGSDVEIILFEHRFHDVDHVVDGEDADENSRHDRSPFQGIANRHHAGGQRVGELGFGRNPFEPLAERFIGIPAELVVPPDRHHRFTDDSRCHGDRRGGGDFPPEDRRRHARIHDSCGEEDQTCSDAYKDQ